MPIAAVDNRTSRRGITYHTGRALSSAAFVDIPKQTASGGSAYITQVGTSGNITQVGTSANITTGTGVPTNVTTANLTGADLYGANLTGATNLTGADLYGAKLAGANLTGATRAGTGLSANITDQGASGLGVDLANLVIAGSFCIIGQLASLSVSASPSIRVEVPDVQSAVDDPPKTVSNDDLSRALKAARTRGRALVAKLLSGKDMLTTDEFGKLIGVTCGTVNQKRKRQEVLALKGVGRAPRFPKWQLGKDRRPFRALPELFDRLGGNPWTVYRFLVQHHPELNGMTGVEALQRGQANRVLDAAESTLTAAS
jgi:uncharacterized protein YjbI with pentapeptide repeats